MAGNGSYDKLGLAYWWLVGLGIVLAVVIVVVVVIATVLGVYTPILGTGTAVVLFGPPFYFIMRDNRRPSPWQ